MKTALLPAAIGLALCVQPGLSLADNEPTQPQTASPHAPADAADQPRAVYLGFMRPPGPGRDYDTWADAVGPDVGEVEVDASRLPSRVDNSQRPQFPPIYRQRWGTCGQFTAAVYMFSYEMNVLNGTAADSQATRFPADFSWNMINRADGTGSEAYHGWEVARHVGLPTQQAYGGVQRGSIGEWPDGYDVWRDAMNFRVTGYRYTQAHTLAQLNDARGWLYDRNQPGGDQPTIGGLLAMDGRMGDRQKVTRTIPQGEHAAGEDLWLRWGPTGYGHGLTCVGYDDNVGYDVNGDGQITNNIDINGDGEVTLADWERGAYIIVNSWGENWSGDGRIYLLYSAMIDPGWRRGNYLGRVEVGRHTPRMTLRLNLACDDRTDLRITIGLAGDADANAPEHTLAPQAFNGWSIFGNANAGHVPMAGPGNNQPIEVGIDLTELLEQLGADADGSGKVFVRFSRADGSSATGQVHEAAVRFYDEQGAFISEQPITIDNGGFGERPLEIGSSITGLPRR